MFLSSLAFALCLKIINGPTFELSHEFLKASDEVVSVLLKDDDGVIMLGFIRYSMSFKPLTKADFNFLKLAVCKILEHHDIIACRLGNRLNLSNFTPDSSPLVRACSVCTHVVCACTCARTRHTMSKKTVETVNTVYHKYVYTYA